MKRKLTIITLLIGIFLISGLSLRAGERVYIRLFILGDIGKTQLVIWEKGEVSETEIANPYANHTESLKSLTEILEKYFNTGFKLTGIDNHDINNNKAYTEYILEKN
ncbi:MAG TPA: hypothetical protein VG603_00765 [Chitinophagales bacterium]|nr:hypothetical protein [Chitinophagales bacterium]